jgi:glycosyltransferase involved in cell wall biosynthesis
VKQPSVRRVVVFAPHFAEYSSRLALALAERVEVLLFLDAKNQAQEIDAALLAQIERHMRLIAFNSVGRGNRIKSLARIAAAVLRFRPDVILVQEQIDALTAWVCRVVGRLFPVLLTVHDPAPHSGADTQYVIDNAGNRRAIRAIARAYHVHGPFCRRQLLSEMGAGKPVVETAHGVILTPPPKTARRAPEPGRVLMFGRMEAYKGLEVLVDAADLLEKRGVSFRLAIAGRGPELERLAGRIAGRANMEIFNRYLTPAEASAEFQRAAVAVTPYLNATQSGVIAAAFGNGCPVVASDAGGLADAVADSVNGLLAPPGDAQKLAEALARPLTDPDLLKALAAGARASAQTTCAWPQIAATLLDFCQARILSAKN